MLYHRHFIALIATLLGSILFNNSTVRADVFLGNQHQLLEEQEILISSIIQFEPPSGNGDPNSTAAGGSRSSCPQRQAQSNSPAIPLTALLPKKTSGQWLTIKQRPTLFVYVPPTSASTILFQLKDQEEEIIYQNLVPISASAGQIVDITIPENAPLLNVQEEYQWSVFLLCKYHNSSSENIDLNSFLESYDLMNEPWVMGTITRINPPHRFNQQTNNLSLHLANEYAQKGLWFETLATLHAMIQERPQETELLEVWRELLASQGLEEQITQAQVSP